MQKIQDDILDVTSTLEVLGKPVGSDVKNQKATYVSMEGIQKAEKDAGRLFCSAMARIPEDTFLQELLCYLMHREK